MCCFDDSIKFMLDGNGVFYKSSHFAEIPQTDHSLSVKQKT